MSTSNNEEVELLKNVNGHHRHVQNGIDLEIGRSEERKRLSCLWFDMTHYHPAFQITILSIGVCIFFMLCSSIEEYSFKYLPKFEHGWYLTFFELICFFFFGLMERQVAGEALFGHTGPMSGHMGIAVAMALARGLTNVSIQYLNYPTQVIFKSMKLLTVIVGSAFFLNNRHHVLEYLATIFYVTSAVCFSLGDIDLEPNYNMTGIAIVLLSLVADSFHSNQQERVLKRLGAGEVETLIFSNLFSALLVLLYLILSGKLMPAVRYCHSIPISYLLFIIRAIVIYCGVKCYLTLVNIAGNVFATTMTTIRKILTILVSFFFFPKPFTIKYLYGILAFGFALGLNIKALQLISKNKQTNTRKN